MPAEFPLYAEIPGIAVGGRSIRIIRVERQEAPRRRSWRLRRAHYQRHILVESQIPAVQSRLGRERSLSGREVPRCGQRLVHRNVVEDVIEGYPKSAANDGLLISQQPGSEHGRVRETEDRRDVVPVRIGAGLRQPYGSLTEEERGRPGARGIQIEQLVCPQQHRPDTVDEIRTPAVLLLHRAEELVAQAEIQGEVSLDLDVVLEEKRERIPVPVAEGAARADGRGVQQSPS